MPGNSSRHKTEPATVRRISLVRQQQHQTSRNQTPKKTINLRNQSTGNKHSNSQKKKFLRVYTIEVDNPSTTFKHSGQVGLTIIESLKNFIDSTSKTSTNASQGKKRVYTQNYESSFYRTEASEEVKAMETPIRQLAQSRLMNQQKQRQTGRNSAVLANIMRHQSKRNPFRNIGQINHRPIPLNTRPNRISSICFSKKTGGHQ